MHRRSSRLAARLTSDTAWPRHILGRRCGALNDRAPSWEEQEGFELHAREDQPDGRGRSSRSIALRGPVARASYDSRVAVPTSATRGSEKPARTGREFIVNGNRRMNGAGFGDRSLEF